MRVAIFVLLFGLNCRAHMMSLSSGEVRLEGATLTYTLTMPLFEIVHTDHPEETLLAHIQFGNAHLTTHECHPDPAHDSYVCRATYLYSAPPDRLDVHCTFSEVTVPNHVHLLRAFNGRKRDQAVFDSAFTSASLRFRPPTVAEQATQQIGKSAVQVVTGLIPLLFLVTLALAAANWRDLAVLTALFLAGLWIGAIIPWIPAPRFLESAAALAVAYLAVEVLFLPHSKARWLLAACLGVVPGLVLAGFIRQSELSLPYAYLGTAIADIAVLTLASAFTFRYPKARRIPAALTLATSLGWFFLVLSR